MKMLVCLLFAALCCHCIAFARPTILTRMNFARGGYTSASGPLYGDAGKADHINITATPIGPNDPTFKVQSNGKRGFIWSFMKLFTSTESFFSIMFKVLISDPDLLGIFSKLASYSFWTFFLLSVLGTMGVDTKPLLSLVSVAGLTVGLAAKDIIANSFSGIFILLTRPFERDAVISVNGYKGKVLSMDMRYVRLQNLHDKGEVLLPLSMVYNNAITIEQPRTYFN